MTDQPDHIRSLAFEDVILSEGEALAVWSRAAQLQAEADTPDERGVAAASAPSSSATVALAEGTRAPAGMYLVREASRHLPRAYKGAGGHRGGRWRDRRGEKPEVRWVSWRESDRCCRGFRLQQHGRRHRSLPGSSLTRGRTRRVAGPRSTSLLSRVGEWSSHPARTNANTKKTHLLLKKAGLFHTISACKLREHSRPSPQASDHDSTET